MKLQNEEWRPVVGFEGSYEVSDQGRIRSIARTDNLGRPVRARVMRPRVGRYAAYDLRKDGRYRSVYAHRAVLEAFVGPCPARHEVRMQTAAGRIIDLPI
jgi:hypothetical protein